uniref:Uncharacterized protein n=1 Tax=Setaria viridis TaxID=4556 RepID=A0A4U6U484_SETVI|nr:hypothetical protein SEVIR_6G058050v2 [Setaria viridis]
MVMATCFCLCAPVSKLWTFHGPVRLCCSAGFDCQGPAASWPISSAGSD